MVRQVAAGYKQEAGAGLGHGGRSVQMAGVHGHKITAITSEGRALHHNAKVSGEEFDD